MINCLLYKRAAIFQVANIAGYGQDVATGPTNSLSDFFQGTG
jgi:hypothetical protein